MKMIRVRKAHLNNINLLREPSLMSLLACDNLCNIKFFRTINMRNTWIHRQLRNNYIPIIVFVFVVTTLQILKQDPAKAVVPSIANSEDNSNDEGVVESELLQTISRTIQLTEKEKSEEGKFNLFQVVTKSPVLPQENTAINHTSPWTLPSSSSNNYTWEHRDLVEDEGKAALYRLVVRAVDSIHFSCFPARRFLVEEPGSHNLASNSAYPSSLSDNGMESEVSICGLLPKYLQQPLPLTALASFKGTHKGTVLGRALQELTGIVVEQDSSRQVKRKRNVVLAVDTHDSKLDVVRWGRVIVVISQPIEVIAREFLETKGPMSAMSDTSKRVYDAEWQAYVKVRVATWAAHTRAWLNHKYDRFCTLIMEESRLRTRSELRAELVKMAVFLGVDIDSVSPELLDCVANMVLEKLASLRDKEVPTTTLPKLDTSVSMVVSKHIRELKEYVWKNHGYVLDLRVG